MSCKSVPQECPTRVTHKSILQECPRRVSHKSVLQECHLDICSFSNVFAFGFVGSILFHFSTPIFLSCPLSAALSFFLLFLRLFRYLFRFLTRAPPSGTVCVCVSHPVPKGSTSRWRRPIVDTCANEAVPRWGMRRLITSVYLLNFWTSCHPTFPRFDSWFFMFPPPNLGFAAELRRSFTTAEFCSQGKQPLLKHPQFLGPFTVLFHRHPSHRGNCVN